VSAGKAGRIDAFLKRSHKWGFCKDIVTLNELLIKFGSSLLRKMQSTVHCLNLLLPPKNITDYKIATANTSYPSVILMFISVLLLIIGLSLVCDFLYACVIHSCTSVA